MRLYCFVLGGERLIADAGVPGTSFRLRSFMTAPCFSGPATIRSSASPISLPRHPLLLSVSLDLRRGHEAWTSPGSNPLSLSFPSDIVGALTEIWEGRTNSIFLGEFLAVRRENIANDNTV